MCHTGRCPYEYGSYGECCRLKLGEVPPSDAWCSDAYLEDEGTDEHEELEDDIDEMLEDEDIDDVPW